MFAPEKSLGHGVRKCVGMCVIVYIHKTSIRPCWCGTKCHSLIRINSPIQALRLGTNTLWDKDVCVVTHCFSSLSFPLLSHFVSHIKCTHTHTLGNSDFTFHWPTRGVFGQMCKTEQHNQKAVTAAGHELYTSLSLSLSLSHFLFHTQTHTFLSLILYLCLCQFDWWLSSMFDVH